MPRIVAGYTTVAFYEADQEFAWMANTYRQFPVKLPDSTGKEITWPTTEHYFQAMKFSGNNPQEISYRQQILGYNASFSKFPEFAKKIAPQAPKQHWDEWDGNPIKMDGRKHKVMRTAIQAKIKQNPQLKQELLKLPPDCIIVEATANDKNWGDGNDGSGTNHLGIIWMEELRRLHLEQNSASKPLPKDTHADYQKFNQNRLGKSLYTYPVMSVPAKPSSLLSFLGSFFTKENPNKNVGSHPAPINSPQAANPTQTALQYVESAINKKGYPNVTAQMCINNQGHYDLVLAFPNPQKANEFKLSICGKDTRHLNATTLLLGEEKARRVFTEQLNIAQYGHKNPRDTWKVLVFQHTSVQQQPVKQQSLV